MRSKWIVLGASVTGSSHLKASLPCQDAHAYCLVGDSTLIIAVADGLGSAAHAEIAAQIAVSAALEYASEFTPPILAQSNENVETAEGRGGNEDETPWLRLLQETFQFAHAALVAEAQKSQV